MSNGFFDQHGTWIPQAVRRTPGQQSQAMFEAITSSEHKVDLTLPAHKSPSAAERATWRQAAA